MRTFRSSAGPFAERPYYTVSEIEKISVDSLRKEGLFPDEPSPIRIDRFIEKRFGIIPEYRDLGPGVLGMAEFGKKGVKGIVIAQSLDDESSVTSERRIRTTMAHEGGHGLLHTHLFAFETEALLFGECTPNGPVVLCRDFGTGKSTKYTGQWWEVQANMAMGSLLMPRSLVLKAIDKFLEPSGQLGLKSLIKELRKEAVSELSEVFDVNPIVATIKLDQLFPAGQASQLRL